jgi:hypothetical protein
MTKSVGLILEKMCSQVFKDNSIAYFLTDNLGKILQWGGNLADLNIPVPKKEKQISKTINFMKGILPLIGESMEFSCLKMSDNVTADALLFKFDKEYGLIIWDTYKSKQKSDELKLFLKDQKELKPHLLEDLFAALNFAVLEMDSLGHFVLIGSPPSWFEHIPLLPGKTFLEHTHEEDVFNFLGNFIQKAKALWEKKHKGSFRSGICIHKDHNDQELSFEATAIDLHGKKLLVIAQDVNIPIV